MQEIYNLVQRIGAHTYYICDLHGTLSKSNEDAMIFLDQETAIKHQGIFEGLFEDVTGQIAKIREVPSDINLLLYSRRVTETLINQISESKRINFVGGDIK